jgi:hypothetical protein
MNTTTGTLAAIQSIELDEAADILASLSACGATLVNRGGRLYLYPPAGMIVAPDLMRSSDNCTPRSCWC